MSALIGFGFLVGGILAINWALQILWRPFIGDRPSDEQPATHD